MKKTARLTAALGAAAALTAGAAEQHDGARASVACQACHGSNGISLSPVTPNLAAQKPEYLAQQLRAFRSGERKHALMSVIAKDLTDADISALAAFWSGLPAAAAQAAPTPEAVRVRSTTLPFPADFPRGYTRYYADESTPAEGISHYYANSLATEAARAGKPMPAGSVIVVTTVNPQLDADKKPQRDAAGRFVTGPIQQYSVMAVRENFGAALPELLRNGDWSYALFDAQQVRKDDLSYASCFACHKGVAKDDYVFTYQHLAGKAGAGQGSPE